MNERKDASRDGQADDLQITRSDQTLTGYQLFHRKELERFQVIVGKRKTT